MLEQINCVESGEKVQEYYLYPLMSTSTQEIRDTFHEK